MSFKTVYECLAVLKNKLLEAEHRRLNTWLTRLNQTNKKLQQVSTDGFLYEGRFYLPKDTSVLLRSRQEGKVTLHESLHEEMGHYLRDRNTVEEEVSLVVQVLLPVLTPCRNDQDRRDALPECLIQCFDHYGYSRLPRTREPAWTVQDNPRALRQFNKYLPQMELYSTSRLFA